MSTTIYTIGHSNHSIEKLMALLAKHSIELIIDVRSQPYSRHNPQFNRPDLHAYLTQHEMNYQFLGEELGARSKNPLHYTNGQMQYEALAASDEFKRGLERIRNETLTANVSLLCAEKDPINCHRAILICRHLRSNAMRIMHILADGRLESTDELETRLLAATGLPEQDLFTTREEMIERAYGIQGRKIAYSAPPEERE